MDRRQSDRSDLNLLPMMNLVSLLIPLLLMGTQLVALSSIDIAQPAAAPTPGPVSDDFHLVVRIEPEGFFVDGAEDVLGEASLHLACEERCTDKDDWPHDELVQRLVEVKEAHPAETRVMVIPDSRVTYQVIVRTLDATRARKAHGEWQELFPEASIGSR
ncbi:MAG: hypothetical protein EP330_02920 [Deltaproteobacteria bacterium]|nr:MAG: hypothetical protein EP330_02920 [Deltaproteobacteria bacterium]